MLSFASVRPSLAAFPFLLSALTGCGVAYQPARNATFEVDSSKQIDDDDIKKAYEAKPQMPREVRVAYYTFDPEIAKDLDVTLAKLPGVVSVYRIPPLMVTGQRRLDQENPWAQPKDVTVKKLRLFAARAHADVLIVIDRGYRSGGANGLAALNILILPIFILPFLDNTVKGYTEGFVIDVRNGYLYGHVTEDDSRGEAFATIYGKSTKEHVDEQWTTLRGALQKDLGNVIAAERAAGVAVSKGSPPVPVTNVATPAPASGPLPNVATPAPAPVPVKR
jgi:hypothetical protein